MRPILALVLLAIGVALLVSGIAASDSLQSTFTKMFSGVPSERAQWLLIGGIAALVIGSILFLRRGRE